MHRLCRFIVRCYPRAWRERYEVEMRALLEESGTSWLVIADLVRGAMNERGRHAWRVLTGHADVTLTDGQRFWLAWISAGAISVVGWMAGRGLEPFVPDDLNGLHILFALFVITGVPRTAETPPVYVMHPLKPPRLLRLRAPFHWPRVPARWVALVSTSCFVLFAVGQGATASVPTSGSVSVRGFAWWFWAFAISTQWALTIINRPNMPTRTSS